MTFEISTDDDDDKKIELELTGNNTFPKDEETLQFDFTDVIA